MIVTKNKRKGGNDVNDFFNKLLEINSFLMAVGFGSITTLVTMIFKMVIKTKRDTEKRFKNLEFANIAMLHDKIYKQCSDFLEQGWISVDDLENLDYLWRGYRGLGGNGTGEVLYKKVQNLPNLKSEREEK